MSFLQILPFILGDFIPLSPTTYVAVLTLAADLLLLLLGPSKDRVIILLYRLPFTPGGNSCWELTPEKVKEVEEVNGPSLESPCYINTEANKIQSFEKSTTDTLKRDRENHFLLNFSRALWNVLKEYKNKLEKDNLAPCEYIVFDKEYLKELEDKDFSSEIAGLVEAGLIASKLSQRDMNISNEDENSLNFCPESPLSR
ncbi:hypothetical protein L2E82_20929 [Cichorium intybus]|uniref:Uncharacterized protein n=1 Tax=Cichorium intybus TaxID=13427 RepID=A0ACB9DV51_CICIN|nr:hypothetical protein L2E82_20929 [Cichorium intybus]